VYLASARGVCHAPANVDLYVAAFGPAQLLQSPQERFDTTLTLRVVCGLAYEHADTPHPLALLPMSSKGPCRRTSNKRDELSPLHLSLGHESVPGGSGLRKEWGNVRFGSKADICGAARHVRFTPQ